jgi:hypothetical protein
VPDQRKEFKKWCDKNPDEVERIFSKAEEDLGLTREECEEKLGRMTNYLQNAKRRYRKWNLFLARNLRPHKWEQGNARVSRFTGKPREL